MIGSYSITTVNRSSVAWALHDWNAPSDTLFTINTQPNKTLLGGNGQEILAWDQSIKFIATGGTEGYGDGLVIWKAPNGKCFGVKIHIPLQIFDLGTSPYFQVKTEQNGAWDGEHRSDPYNVTKDIGFDVTVKAVADHATLHVTATINDLGS
ncbi:hypothetical protein MN608_08446 [Microdochium nivale]|nr:hypothetical protein MN608_08446 [Microdochium nivale]